MPFNRQTLPARLLLILLLALAAPAWAEGTIEPQPSYDISAGLSRESDSAGLDYLYNFARIPGRAVAEVFRTDRAGLTRNAIALGSIGLALAADQNIRNWSQKTRNSDSDRIAAPLYKIGTIETTAAGLIGGYGYSLLAGDQYLVRTLHLSVQALAITQGFTTLFKKGVERTRPRDSPDDPFDRSPGSQSFFSGHASGTWAAVTVLAKRYPDRPIFKWGAYTLAGAVSLSRIHDDGHWSSDVLTGSLVGYGVAHLTVEMMPASFQDIIILPILDGDTRGIRLAVRF